jgi:hypothetical protein
LAPLQAAYVRWKALDSESFSYVLSVLIAKFKMQLKKKWVEINKPTRAFPDVTLVMRPLTGACDVLHGLVRAKRKDGKLFPQYITDTL